MEKSSFCHSYGDFEFFLHVSSTQIFEKYWFINRLEFSEHCAVLKRWGCGWKKVETGLKEVLST